MAKKWKAYPWQDRVENIIATTNQPNLSTTDTDITITELTINNTLNTAIVAAVIEEDEEIDVVGDSPANIAASDANNHRAVQHTTTSVIVGNKLVPTCWGPSSPTAGTTAPSPPLDGRFFFFCVTFFFFFTCLLPHEKVCKR